MGTPQQLQKMTELQSQGYKWDKEMSGAACGVILKKGNDIYFFGLTGEIEHNPQGLTIKL